MTLKVGGFSIHKRYELSILSLDLQDDLIEHHEVDSRFMASRYAPLGLNMPSGPQRLGMSAGSVSGLPTQMFVCWPRHTSSPSSNSRPWSTDSMLVMTPTDPTSPPRTESTMP